MALNKKYADLPDLDLAPDVYETPELTDDASTVPTATTARSPSPAYEEDAEIDRQGLHPRQARTLFSPAQVDARGADFSDSIGSNRGSYITSHRRRRRHHDGTEEIGDLSEDEDESLEKRLARLRREAEEVQEELDRRSSQEGETQQHDNDLEGSIVDLSRLLQSLQSSSQGLSDRSSLETDLSKIIAAGTISGSRSKVPESTVPPPPRQAPSEVPSSLLSQAAAFDKRLALLEDCIGPVPMSNSSEKTDTQPRPILPTLTTLTNQLSILTTAVDSTSSALANPNFDEITARMRSLTANANALTQARKLASNAAEAEPHGTSPSTPSRRGHSHKNSITSTSISAAPTFLEDSAHTAKLHALYNTLPTINSLSPILPAVLERLRSLRAIHAGAGMAAEDLSALEKGQEEMRAEIQRWREGLSVVEKKVAEGEATMGKNLETIGKWVVDLEARAKKLQTNV